MIDTEYFGVPPSICALGTNTLAYEKRTLSVTTLIAFAILAPCLLEFAQSLKVLDSTFLT
jgi:hypothetical protein